MAIAYVALGANLSNRVAKIESALSLFASIPYIQDGFISVQITNTSCLYETISAYVDGPNYLNCVAELTIKKAPCTVCPSPQICAVASLLHHCLDFELKLGRDRSGLEERNCSRVIDIDLLFYLDDSGQRVEANLSHFPGCPALIESSSASPVTVELVPRMTPGSPLGVSPVINHRSAMYMRPIDVTVPHPRIRERRFVLQPWSDIAPDLSLGNGMTVASCLQSLLQRPSERTPLHCREPLKMHLVVGHDTLWPVTGLKTDCKLVGILNLTPDSFSDGGQFWNGEFDQETENMQESNKYDAGIQRLEELIALGCDGIDIGAESSRPGATPVSVEVEINRLRGVVKHLGSRAQQTDTVFFIDTRHADVFQWCFMRHPRFILNDVSGLRHDDRMISMVAERLCSCVVMHSRGTSEDMKSFADYKDVVAEVGSELNATLTSALRQGIFRWRLMADPGIGFAKTAEQSLELLRNLNLLKQKLPAGIPLMAGFSRKSFLRDDPNASWEALDQKALSLLDSNRVYESVCCLRVHDPLVFKEWRDGS